MWKMIKGLLAFAIVIAVIFIIVFSASFAWYQARNEVQLQLYSDCLEQALSHLTEFNRRDAETDF